MVFRAISKSRNWFCQTGFCSGQSHCGPEKLTWGKRFNPAGTGGGPVGRLGSLQTKEPAGRRRSPEVRHWWNAELGQASRFRGAGELGTMHCWLESSPPFPRWPRRRRHRNRLAVGSSAGGWPGTRWPWRRDVPDPIDRRAAGTGAASTSRDSEPGNTHRRKLRGGQAVVRPIG